MTRLKQARQQRKRRDVQIDKQINQLPRKSKGKKRLQSQSVSYRPPEARGLTAQQMHFCEQYIVDLNPKQAAIRAGYSKRTALNQGNNLMGQIPIKRYIAHLKVERAKKLQVSQERIVEELARIAYADHRTFYNQDGFPISLEAITDDQQAAIKDIQWESIYQIDYVEPADGKKRKRDKIHYVADEHGQPKEFKRVKKYMLHDNIQALRMLGHHIGMSLDKPTEKAPVYEKNQQEIDFDALIRKLDAKQLERLTEIMLFAARAQTGVDISADSKEVPDQHWSKQTMGGEQ